MLVHRRINNSTRKGLSGAGGSSGVGWCSIVGGGVIMLGRLQSAAGSSRWRTRDHGADICLARNGTPGTDWLRFQALQRQEPGRTRRGGRVVGACQRRRQAGMHVRNVPVGKEAVSEYVNQSMQGHVVAGAGLGWMRGVVRPRELQREAMTR
jgi:hypothetical protein